MTTPPGENPPRPNPDNPIPPRPRFDTSSLADFWAPDEGDDAKEDSPARPADPDAVWAPRNRQRPEETTPPAEDEKAQEPVPFPEDEDTRDTVPPVENGNVAEAEQVEDEVRQDPVVPLDDEEPDDDELSTEAVATLDDPDDTDRDYYEEPRRTSSATKVRRVAWELAQTLVLAALIFLMVRGVAQNFRVEGPSMEPGLHDGQYLLVNKAVYFKLDLEELSRYLPFIDPGDNPSRFLFHGPERGDVVVFRYPRDPSRDFIKRIIGVPGDTVSISNGVVSVNGTVLEEDYIASGANTNMDPKVVPEGSYFVMGDNRPNSSDSRNWGFVPEENIIGKAMFSYWPLSELGGVGNTSIDLGIVKIPLF